MINQHVCGTSRISPGWPGLPDNRPGCSAMAQRGVQNNLLTAHHRPSRASPAPSPPLSLTLDRPRYKPRHIIARMRYHTVPIDFDRAPSNPTGKQPSDQARRLRCNGDCPSVHRSPSPPPELALPSCIVHHIHADQLLRLHGVAGAPVQRGYTNTGHHGLRARAG
jgi:hypothetical protein